MPTYVYKFVDSGETIEIYQAFSDEALTEAPHPSDGKPRPVKKVFTPVGITFKGGGFYKTDASSSSKVETQKATKKEESATPATESKATSTTESKAAPTTESKAAPATTA